ncbi:MAG: hypothetical protein GWN58_04965 [Anaerolineae bacterium]|nr:hypothetical protein [Anaerolineae bacterium]
MYLASVATHGLWNGLAAVITLLSLTAIGTGADGAGLYAMTLGTLLTFLLLALLALGMVGGLAGLTAYARRAIPATGVTLSVRAGAAVPQAASSADPEIEAQRDDAAPN